LSGTSTGIDIYRGTERVRQLTLSGIGGAELFEIQYAVTGESGESTLWLVHRKIAPRNMTVTEDAVPQALDTPKFFETYDPGTWEETKLSGYQYSADTQYIFNASQQYAVSVEAVFTLKTDLPGAERVRCEIAVMIYPDSAGVEFYYLSKIYTDASLFFKSGKMELAGAGFSQPLPVYEYTNKIETQMYTQVKTPDKTRYLFNTPGKYPGTVAVYAGRLCLGGTDEYPSRIWLSRPPDSVTGKNRFLDFTTGENAGDAIAIEENDMAGSRLLWLAAGRRLIAGTAKSTWSDNGAVPTPSSFDMGIVEYSGSAPLRPRGTKEIMVYAGRNGRTLRAVVWQETAQGAGFIDVDISRNAPHLFTSGIRDFDVSDYPYPVVWIVTGDGALVSCTIDLRSGVLAMARHDTAGKFRACAVRRVDGEDDTLFLAAERPEGGIMDIVTLALPEIVDADYEESHYLDCGIRAEFDPPVTEVSLPEPLRRDGIQAFADGTRESVALSEDRSVLLFQNPVRKAHIGLPYKSELSPNTPEIPANGTSIGKKRRVEKALLKVYGSMGGQCGITEEKAVPLPYMRYGQYRLGEAPPPFTGNIDITVGGTIDPEGNLVITHGEPVPFTLLALVERVAILEA
jgi:hypothetical protein